MGRKECLVYTRVVRLQSCQGTRVLGIPLRNAGEENDSRDKHDTYYFHTAIHTTRHELVFLDVRPVYAIDLTRVFMPSADGESLGHLSHLYSPALRPGESEWVLTFSITSQSLREPSPDAVTSWFSWTSDHAKS